MEISIRRDAHIMLISHGITCQMQMKTTMKYHYLSIRMTNTWNIDNTNAGKEMKQQGFSFIFGEDAKLYSHFWKQFGVSLHK